MQELSPSKELASPVAPPRPKGRIRPLFLLAVLLVTAACVGLALAGYLEPVALGAIQGLSEFLPISSSAHLILTPWFFGWQSGTTDRLTFIVALHLGTLIALVGYFWRDWAELLMSAPGMLRWLSKAARGDRSHIPTLGENVLLTMIIATIPGLIAGALLAPFVDYTLRSPQLLAVTLTATGLLLHIADSRRPERKSLEELTWRDALLIGVAQACALIPGISRAGATITMSRLLTLDRSAAARYSFLLSAPITAAAIAFKFDAILNIPSAEVVMFVIGVATSAIVGALAIDFLLDYVGRFGFSMFAVYRAVLAITVVAVIYTRGF